MRSLSDTRDFLYDHLLNNIIPFWLKHAIDPAGGINTCIRDDGSIINREKWLWSQWRAVWVFSKLYNRIERHREWLDIARSIYQFCTRHGWDEQVQGWILRVDHDGKPLTGCDSIYADGFAMYGLGEYIQATGGAPEAITWARRTADSVLKRLRQPHDQIPHFPYPVPPGARVHGLPMIFSLCFWELGQMLDDAGYRQAGVSISDDIFSHFYRPDRDLIVERISTDNSEYPAPLGTAVVPGHIVEDMWFQIHIARERNDRDRIAQSIRLIKRHMEVGWDNEFGGLLLAIDADTGGTTEGWKFADTKLWWPQTEALYALLLAFHYTGERWCLEWYDKVHDYAFKHYPDPVHGEWTQKLDRRGQKITDVVALPVKDPFHLPRALILCIDVLDRMLARRV